MDLGLGLPVSNPAVLPEWARRAEAAGFDSLALLDRLTYDNPEPLVALGVLAGATNRVRLQTEVLLAPLRPTALLAKQVATLDAMSGGRFVLGVGVGGREDDHAAAGVPIERRGAILDRQLVELRQIWNGDAIGPFPASPPPILIGGFAPAALRRVARHADGLLCAAPLAWAGRLVEQVREEWAAAGRPGRPRLVCQVNVAAGGPASIERARRAVADYYAFTGSSSAGPSSTGSSPAGSSSAGRSSAGRSSAGLSSAGRSSAGPSSAGHDGWGAPLSDPGQIAETVAAYREFGADELVLYCYGDDPGQVEELAAAARLAE
jgi:alkanesulfonate monooxygenase SsuD/methylene tetrahydromethanopterin reductase-like flavin-dependent oxidoreductase (luciferase family)